MAANHQGNSWQLDRRTIMALLTFFLVISCCCFANGAEAGKAELPPEVEKFLGWFPENTETIIVAKTFRIQPPLGKAEFDSNYIKSLSLGDLPQLEEEAGFNQLVERNVVLAVNGGADFESVSAFGSLRYQGCSIVRLADPLPNAGRNLSDTLRKKAKQVRKIAGIEVFVFAERSGMEAYVEPKPWQGQFIALLAPDTLLCATSDAFLQKLLDRRSADASRRRALPPGLPEWNYVDVSASAWALRHIPANGPAQLVSGLAWNLLPGVRSVFEVTYVPIMGESARPIAKVWSMSPLGARPLVFRRMPTARLL